MSEIQEHSARLPATLSLVPAGKASALAPSAGKLLANHLARHAQNVQASLNLLTVGHLPETWQSWLALQAAAQQKLIELQGSWWQGWGSWLQRLPQLQQANTLSKLLDQEMDLTVSALQHQGEQWVDLLDLYENFQVNYGYWAQQQQPVKN